MNPEDIAFIIIIVFLLIMAIFCDTGGPDT